MVFSSTSFLFGFLPLLFIIYFLVPRKFREIRNIVLLLFSLVFYGCNEKFFVWIMIGSIACNYVFGLLLENCKKKKLVLFISVIMNLGLLVYYKYTGFIVDNINGFFGADIVIKKIIMPVGISFFTFQGMSYVFDVYYGWSKAQKNILNVMLYIALFPQLVAGPIVRYQTIEEELTSRSENENLIANGIGLFIIGLGKKMIIANQMGIIADAAFSEPSLTTALCWLGAVCYTLQIYFDFSAYSDMAVGLGKVFGFTFPQNFNYPYIASSITDFWRRWHISLSTWFRDYLYIPLGGNRCSKGRHIINIMTVWLATGIWHGASWNFIVWGVYYGVILIIEKFFLKNVLEKMGSVLRHIYTMLIVIIGFVFFRADTLTSAVEYLKVMFGAGALTGGNELQLLSNYYVFIIMGLAGSLPVSALVKKLVRGGAYSVLRYVYLVAVLSVSVMFLAGSTFNPFIYFRF